MWKVHVGRSPPPPPIRNIKHLVAEYCLSKFTRNTAVKKNEYIYYDVPRDAATVLDHSSNESGLQQILFRVNVFYWLVANKLGYSS